MTVDEVVELLRPHVENNPEGIFHNGEFDLDVCLGNSGWLTLWLDDDTKVDLPTNDAVMIQESVGRLGRRLLHTWGQQYSEKP